MYTLEVFDPSGATEVLRLHASRIDTLDGKRIGFVSNDEWQAHRMLPIIADRIKKKFKDVEIVPFSEFPIGNSRITDDETIQKAKELEVDAIIVGNAS
jgi:hypothetical protein